MLIPLYAQRATGKTAHSQPAGRKLLELGDSFGGRKRGGRCIQKPPIAIKHEVHTGFLLWIPLTYSLSSNPQRKKKKRCELATPALDRYKAGVHKINLAMVTQLAPVTNRI